MITTHIIDSTPIYLPTVGGLHKTISALVGLSDGSFVACYRDNITVERWLISPENTLEYMGAFVGHNDFTKFAVEKDINTLITGSSDRTLKVWDVTTCKCLNSVAVDDWMSNMIITKDRSKLICRTVRESIEIRRSSDLSLLSIIRTGRGDCCCELKDGSFVSDSETELVRWNVKGSVIQTFSGHFHYIHNVIELNDSDILVSSTRNDVRMWDVSTGECLRILDVKREIIKLSRGRFVTWERQSSVIRVWNEQGEVIDAIPSEVCTTAIVRVRDFIVTSYSSSSTTSKFAVRRLK